MDKTTEKRFRHPRPVTDFRVDSVALLMKIARKHEKAGFPSIPTETILRRYWQYVSFLQEKKLTTKILAEKCSEVTAATELRNSDLTEAGFRFVQYSHDRWLNRTYKDKGPTAEEKFLQEWYKKFRAGYVQPAVQPDEPAAGGSEG